MIFHGGGWVDPCPSLDPRIQSSSAATSFGVNIHLAFMFDNSLGSGIEVLALV